MAIAGLLLVAGALAVGGAGLLEARGSRSWAITAAVGGGVAIGAAVLVFLFRPSAEVTLPRTAVQSLPNRLTELRPGKLQCTFDPTRSRVTVSPTPDLVLDWNGEGCVNGRTQYVEASGRWERVLVPEREPTLSVLTLEPFTGRYTDTRYFVPARTAATARAARGTTPGACTTRAETLSRLSERQSALRALLPPLPNEKLAYICRAAL